MKERTRFSPLRRASHPQPSILSEYLDDGLTLKEIKSALNVSESRVSQIHAQAVIHLRTKLRNLRADLGYRDGDPNVKQKYLRKGPAATDIGIAG